MNRKTKSLLLGIFLLAAVFAALYIPALHYDFLLDWDDGIFIIRNPRINFTWDNLRFYFLNPFQDLYTPLPMISLMLDHWIGGLAVEIYRLHNFLLHLAGGIFLFLIFRRMGAKQWIAFAAALLWLIHPQKVESAVWITERKDVLCGALAFASFWFFLRARTVRKTSWTAGILCVLSIFAKPASCTLPFLFLLYDICLLKRPEEWKETLKRNAFPLLSGIAAIVWAGIITAKTNPGKAQLDLLIPVSNLFRYPLTAILPYEIHPIHPTIDSLNDVVFVLAGGIILAFLLIALMRKAKFTYLKIFFCFAAVGGCAMPVLGLLNYTNYHFCDRYNYLVSAVVWGILSLLLTVLWRKYAGERKLILLFLIFSGVFFAGRTLLVLPDWKSQKSFAASLLLRHEKMNIKGVDVTAHIGIRHQDQMIISKVLEHFEPYAGKYIVISQRQQKHTLLFLQGTKAFMENNASLLRKIYDPLISEYLHGEPLDLPMGDGLILEMIRQLSGVCLLENRPKDALLILKAELRFREGKKILDGETCICRYLIARIQNDKPAMKKNLQEAIRKTPGSQSLKKLYGELFPEG